MDRVSPKPVRFFDPLREDRVQALFHVGRPGRSFLETIENLGQHMAQDFPYGFANIEQAITRAAIIAPEKHVSGESGCFEQSPQFVLMTSQPTAFFANQKWRCIAFRFPLFARKHFF